MDSSPSIKSCSRARTTERGFALAMALIISTLYFGLIGLMLFDAQRELAEARRFRARIVALTLAENGAERVAHLIAAPKPPYQPAIHEEDWQGSITGTRMLNADGNFTIKASGTATGVVEVRATVEVDGRIVGNEVHIDFTRHSQ